MIRIRRCSELSTDADRARLAEAKALFRRAFPLEPEQADRLGRLLERPAGSTVDATFEPILLLAESERGGVVGFALAYNFPASRFAFLDWIASDPDHRHRGIGRALYEALRELLAQKSVIGLLLEVPPDDPADVSDPDRLAVNRARVRFYERFGARPIVNTRWDDPPVRKTYDPPYLVLDPLGRNRPIRQAQLRRAAGAILQARYGRAADDPYTQTIITSIRDDPVRLREPRYAEAIDPVAPPGTHLRRLIVVVPEHHEIHHVKERGYVERPARVRAILRAIGTLPIEQIPARHVGEGPIRAVHDPDFVNYLRRASAALKSEETIYPQVFPVRRPDRKPRDLATRAGYYCSDTFTPLSQSAYRAARAAVSASFTAANRLIAGDRFVFALCRPPGHHAERRIYGGFCYFNNAAVAAHALSAHGRVALIDLDYHHGNGQQDIFYNRRDVLTVSLHGDPKDHYPHFAGYVDERGEGEGRGYNRNVPLPDSIGDDAYLAALEKALEIIRQEQPRWLIVSMGYDTMRGDPTGNFDLSPRGIRRIGAAVGRLDRPTLIVQEGGYSLRNLRLGARAFFLGLLAARDD